MLLYYIMLQLLCRAKCYHTSTREHVVMLHNKRGVSELFVEKVCM